MRCTKVVMEGKFRFCGTQAEGRQLRAEWTEEHSLKRNECKVVNAAIPADKAGHLEYLNELAKLADKL